MFGNINYLPYSQFEFKRGQISDKTQMGVDFCYEKILLVFSTVNYTRFKKNNLC